MKLIYYTNIFFTFEIFCSTSVSVHGELVNVSKIIIHPMYNARKKNYDIGLLKLAANVK